MNGKLVVKTGLITAAVIAALACSVFLDDAANRRGEILLEPLGKFPVVRDLKVDRSMISERLKEMHVWDSPADCDRI